MRTISLVIVTLLAALAAGPAGTPASAAAAAMAASVASTGQEPAEGDSTPVPVPEMSEKARRYYVSGNWLWLLGVAWGFAVPLLFLFTGLSARIRDFATRVTGGRWFFVIAAYFVVFSIVSFLLDLPLTYYTDFVRPHAYDLSTQTFGKWVGDTVKSLIVGLIMGGLFLWVPYLLLKRSPRRWWLYTAMLAVPFLFLVMLVTPVWIDPLFNEFGPMKDQALEGRILALAEGAGIEGSRVFEVNKSVDTKTVNAYVTGFMNTRRIVLWDTIIAKLNEEELLFVMGHEMGHYVLGHVLKGILFLSALLGVLLYAAHRTASGLIARHRDRIGFDRLSDIASLPLLLLLLNLFGLIGTPAALAYTRHQEHEADRFGLEITRRNGPAATAFVKLQSENLGNPRPGLLYKLWRSSHPPIGERIDFSNTYRPWSTGEPLTYGRHFR